MPSCQITDNEQVVRSYPYRSSGKAAMKNAIEAELHTIPESNRAPKAEAGRKRRKNTPPATAKEYADAVTTHARLSTKSSLHVGSHLEHLARFMQRPYNVRMPTSAQATPSSLETALSEFVSLYDLDPATQTRVTHHVAIDDFELRAKVLAEKSEHGQLVFVRGSPSPAWLLALATSYKLDPNLLNLHLGLQLGTQTFFEQPALPSVTSATTQLRVTTIGFSNIHFEDQPGRQRRLDGLRQRNNDMLQSYLHMLQDDATNFELGESVVRDCSIHDTQHFSIEQDITVHIQPCNGSWAVFIWLDHGSGLGRGRTAWLTEVLQQGKHGWQSYLPVIQVMPYGDFQSASRQTNARGLKEKDAAPIQQNASLLHLDYGRDLDRHSMSSSAFYAAQEVLGFAAWSESQFLTMLQSKLLKELDINSAATNENPILTNLLHSLKVLGRHVRRLEDNVRFIECWSTTPWSSGPPSTGSTAEPEAQRAAKGILSDYRALLDRARDMQEQCHQSIEIVSKITTVLEARKSIAQAREVTNLTKLAFFFIPLSFVTSFFGMNLQELGQGTVHIWAWAAISVPIFVVSMIFVNPRFSERLMGPWVQWQSGRRHKRLPQSTLHA